jgi:hypothetical protein
MRDFMRDFVARHHQGTQTGLFDDKVSAGVGQDT